jgi:hypothetical protein
MGRHLIVELELQPIDAGEKIQPLLIIDEVKVC